ncbi:glycosyltransferase [Halomonas elongata]|uniref:glycosyltransferase family protein n=1 Tax=Halomonas elongata TaxID=2746 RepID=UPI00336093E0
MSYNPRQLFPEKKGFSPDFLFQNDGVSFFYTYIRKNASTSFKKLFKLMHPGLCPGKEPSLSCMAKYAQVNDLTPEEIDRSFENKVFVYRDPVERVFSVYKNKLIQQDGAEDLLEKLSKASGRDPGLFTFCDFVNDYVALLETERWKEVDAHLYPQVWHLLPITYNMAIPMEHVHREMLKVLPKDICDKAFEVPSNRTDSGSVRLESCDTDSPAIYFQKKYIRENALPKLEQVITPEVEARIKEIYCEDYLMLSRVSDSAGVNPSLLQSSQCRDGYRKLLVQLESSELQNNRLINQLSDAREEIDKKSKEFRDIVQKNTVLTEKLEAARKESQELNSKYQDVFKKYKSANAKYRDVSQRYSALRYSAAYSAGVYLRDASKSLVGFFKLPIRLFRLKKQKVGFRIDLRKGLRYVKWKMVVPLAMRLGIPYSKVAYLSYPRSVKKIIAHFVSHSSVSKTQDGEAIEQRAVFHPPSSAAQEISILGWQDYPPKKGKPYVIGITDEFTTGCFEKDLNLIQPRPDNWYALAEKYRPEFFLIESAWKGNYGSWQYRVADYSNKPGQEVAHICQYAQEKGIPTVFWNKEDPVHHQKFMCSAKLVDHIFTTDANMKISYQKKTGNPNVHALAFAAQPALHKPSPLAGRKSRACFAGSWYGNRHAERGEMMSWLLQAANQYGLDIYDRNYGSGIFPFPEEYQAGIKGSLPYKELCEEYSRYRVFLNVNSVIDSPTMFSRRVFELMACGTPVVSTYAKGIENLFESDAVWLVHSQEEADEALHTLMTDDVEWRRRSLVGIREVFAKHTYAHRLNEIFDRLGIESRMFTDPAIVLVAEAQSHAELEALDRFARQQCYGAFRLGVACAPGVVDHLTYTPFERIVLLQLGEQAAWVAEQREEYPVAGWITPHGYYGEHYLRDLANATLYEPQAAGWAKAPDKDHFAYGGQAVLAGTLWWTSEFLKSPLKGLPDEYLTRPDLYLADSDQFQHGGMTEQRVERGEL